jgi:nitrogen-specific signal transduction histidine kinase
VFNIVNNSFQQIRTQQFEGKVAEGIITLTIMRSHGVTPLLQQTGLNFVDVVIEDNGGGAPDDVFRKIGRPAFTTKKEHGSGFGVAAAKEYFQSIGGDMSWDNIDGGFRTTIRMQEFDSDIHSETRFIEKIRAEAMR